MRLIITADWHLRKEIPSSRLDLNWLEYQKQVIDFIINETIKKQAKLCIVGDIFDKAKDDVEIINLFLNCIESLDIVYCIAGNHDLLYHNSLDLDKCSFGVIWKNEKIKPLWELGKAKHYGEEYFVGSNNGIMFLHNFVYKDSKFSFLNRGFYVDDLIKEYPETKWFFVGDNHEGFIYKKNDKFVINPGCVTIQSLDMIEYIPKIVFVDTEEDIVDWIFIPDFGQKFIDFENLKNVNNKIQSFVELIRNKKELSFDFISNMKNEIKKVDDKELIEYLDNFIKELI